MSPRSSSTISAVPGVLDIGGLLAPVFNLIPPPEEAGLLGFKSGVFDSPTFEVISARTNSDYGLDTDITNIDHFVPLRIARQIIWGVPAAPIHNDLRFGEGQGAGFNEIAAGLLTFLCGPNGNGEEDFENPNQAYQICPHIVGGGPVHEVLGKFNEEPDAVGPVSSNSPETPFLQNPTTCNVSSLSSSLEILGYEGETTAADSPYPATTDCDQLTFNPSQSIAPTTEEADSPSGAEFRLTVPQFESPATPSPSELREATVTLPAGYSLSPNVTNGKTTCSDAEARFGTTLEANCPEDSKIGAISVETPVLPGPLEGYVYLGEPKPGNRFSIILAFNGFGVHVKLPGTVTPDPTNGRIVINFKNLPQTPFAVFNMHIFGSERGPLSTPTQCGSYEVSTVFTPWDSSLSPETSRQFFTVDSGPGGQPCPNGRRPFQSLLQCRLYRQYRRCPYLI